MKTCWMAAVLIVAACVAGFAPVARAEDGAELGDRLDQLEELLRSQAEEIRRLRDELDETKRDRAPAPAPAAPPAARVPAPAPAPVPAPAVPRQAPAGPVFVEGSGASPDGGLSRRRVADPGPLTRYLQPGGGDFRWGGYLTLEYVANSEKNSYFDLYRLILQFDADISDCIYVTSEIEYEHGGTGGAGREGEVIVEYLELGLQLSDGFNPKFGALLIPFGRWNLYHDDPLNDFTKRPWVGRYLVPTGFGQPGIGAEGAFPLGGGALSYNAALTTGYSDDFSASDGVRSARQAWQTDNNEAKQVWGRVAYTRSGGFLDYLEAGLSGTWSRYDDDDEQDLFGYGIDLLARKGPFEFQGEYIHYDYDRPAGAPATNVRGQDGLLLQLAYHFFPCSWRCCRSCIVTDTSHFTLAARYQSMDLDDRRRGATFRDDLQSWGMALNYRITEDTVFRIDYTWFDAVNEPNQHEFTASLSTYF